MRAEIVYQESVVRWVDPARLHELAGDDAFDGRGYLERIKDGRLPDAPAIVATGSKLVEIEAGRAVMTFEPQLRHCNALRQVHGGVISTLLDTAVGYAVTSSLVPQAGFSTVQLNVNFMRALTPGDGDARIESRIVRQGRRVVVAEAAVHSCDGKLCANASATCLITGP